MSATMPLISPSAVSRADLNLDSTFFPSSLIHSPKSLSMDSLTKPLSSFLNLPEGR